MPRSKTRIERLEQACNAAGLHVATWGPGDGKVRYRFFTQPSGYCGPHNGIFTALGWREAVVFLAGRGVEVE